MVGLATSFYDTERNPLLLTLELKPRILFMLTEVAF